MNATELEKPPSKMDAVRIVVHELKNQVGKEVIIQKLLKTRSFNSYVEAEKYFEKASRGSLIYESKPGLYKRVP